MRRFVIDTDTASDDAVALVMALRHPDVRVEAITVVAGNVELDQAVQNALYTVELCGSDVPVYAGAAAPMIRPLQTAQIVHGGDGMGDCGLVLAGRTPAGGRAADVLVDMVLAAPGEITLVTLGPLTNVAVALLRAPEIAAAVDRVVVMGGTGVNGPGNVTPMAEFNLWVDPEAARIVVRSGLPLELVGWDVSIASAVVDDRRERALREVGTDLARFAVDINTAVKAFVTARGLESYDLPDPIAMAHALDPSVAVMRRLAVDVLVGDGGERGVLEVDQIGFSEREPNLHIVTAYPSGHFFSMLSELLG